MELPNTTRVDPQPCAWCGHTLSGLAHLDPEDMSDPRDGEVTVCLYCRGVLVRSGELWRRADKEDWRRLREAGAAGEVKRVQELARRVAGGGGPSCG